MQIKINSNIMDVKEDITVYALLEDLKIMDKTMAVAVNMNVVKKDEWIIFRLQENDEVEVLNFVGGG